MTAPGSAIHPTALVDPKAELDASVRIGPYAVIGPQVRIGAGTTVGAHCVIDGYTTIGRDNRIFPFASVGAPPQDKKYAGEPTRLEIGNGNVFREFCTVNRGTAQDQAVTRIGDDNLFMAYTHVAHDCVIGSHVIMANCATLAGHVHLDDWVGMGGFSAVHQFGKVGAHAYLANNAGVTGDVPPYVMAVGRPAEPHSVNVEGLKRRGFSAEQIRNIREAYRILYRSDLLLADAVEKLKGLAATQPEIRPFVDFIGASTRGLIR